MRLIACSKCHSQFDGSTAQGKSFQCHCGATVENVEHAPIDAVIHRCGACGAGVSLDAVHCEYCQGPIIRDRRQMGLICPECYARNPVASKFCTSCGVHFRPQTLPGEAPERICPADGETTMVGRKIGGVIVHECPNCAGLWVPGDEFDRLVKRAIDAQKQSASIGLGSTGGPERRWTGGNRVAYRKCPDCAGVMNRKNFGGRSGIIVDWCGQHGTWLDADELEQIAAYIMEGGLDQPGSDPAALRGFAGGTPEQFGAMVEGEKLLAQERAKRSKHKKDEFGSVGGTLGDLLSSLLNW